MTKATEKYVIMPFRKARGKLTSAELRPATSEASAVKIAESMSARFAGVAAYAVIVDDETGNMEAPRLLAQFGDVPDLEAA